jgi:hypothetical protein
MSKGSRAVGVMAVETDRSYVDLRHSQLRARLELHELTAHAGNRKVTRGD